MKTYSVSMVRERLAEALDDAQAGHPVFIERRGVIYRISVEPRTRMPRSRKRSIEVLDPAIERGSWTWAWTAGGKDLRLRTRRRRA
jgi:antitoxin (DNA-binding transcriptional repressor) of toxin-antitoxin stability system